jgi:hypothetical protein
MVKKVDVIVGGERIKLVNGDTQNGWGVVIAIRHRPDGLGIEPRCRNEMFFFSTPVQTVPRAHPASCKMGTGLLSQGKIGRGVALSIHPYLLPRLRMSGAIPLLSLWVFILCYVATCYLYKYRLFITRSRCCSVRLIYIGLFTLK